MTTQAQSEVTSDVKNCGTGLAESGNKDGQDAGGRGDDEQAKLPNRSRGVMGCQHPEASHKVCLASLSLLQWVGVLVTLAGLGVAVYYGARQLRASEVSLRYQIWEAENDFRSSCQEDKVSGYVHRLTDGKTRAQKQSSRGE